MDDRWPVGPRMGHEVGNPRDSEPRLDLAELFDRLPVPLYATARDGTVLAANRAFWDIWDGREDDRESVRAEHLYADPSERHRMIAEMDKSDLELLDWDQVIETPRGIRWIKPLSRVVRDADGKVQRMEGGFLTVTPPPDTESVEQRQHILLERTTDVVAIVDPEGRLTWANAAARKLLEITEATVLGRPLLEDLIKSNLPITEGFASAPSQGEQTFSINGRDHHFWLNIESHLGSDGRPAFYSFIGRDLSTLDRTRAQLAESVFQRDKVIAAVAHEIRTPLTSILGLARVLAENLEATEDEQNAELARLLTQEASDISEMVEDLLSTASTRRSRVRREPVDLRTEAFSSLRTIGSAEGEIAVSGDAVALGDASRVRQIIRNLLVNAQRYGAPPISVALDTDDDWVGLCVIDHGPGVSPDLLQMIFEPFVGKDHDTALGLGLTVSRTLAKQMGGTLTYTRDGGATVFELRLPAADTQPSPTPDALT